MPDYSFADLLDSQAVLGDNGAVFLNLNGTLSQFDMNTGTVAWASNLANDIKFQTDENHVVAQGGDKLYDLGLVQTAALSSPSDLNGSLMAFGPSEVSNSTLMFDSSFEATLLVQGLNGTISHYAADSYLMNSTEGSAGVMVQQGKIEGGSVQKTPNGKAGATTDSDTDSELRLVPVSDCGVNNGTGRLILYELQRMDSKPPQGHYFITEHVTDPTTACRDFNPGFSTDFGGWESGQTKGDGNEFFDRLGSPLLATSGSLYQSFVYWDSKLYHPDSGNYDSCINPQLPFKALKIRYPAQNGHPVRDVGYQQDRSDPPVSVRGAAPATEWITNHFENNPDRCVFKNWF